MQLCIGLLHQRHPEFRRVPALAKTDHLGVRVIGKQSIDDDGFPCPVLKELEGNKPMLLEMRAGDYEFADEVALRVFFLLLPRLFLRRDYDQCAREPGLPKRALLNFPVFLHHEFTFL